MSSLAKKYIYRTPAEIDVRIRKVIRPSQSFDEMVTAIASYVSLNYVKVVEKKKKKEK